MSKPLTLNSVRLELDSWRATREKQGRLPDTIWDKILNHLKTHSMTDISRELKVSHEQIRNKLNVKNDNITSKSEVKIKKNVDTKSCAFVEVKNPAYINNDSIDFSSGTRIEIKRADNASMIIDNLDGNAISLIMNNDFLHNKA
jgi:hypothetical protein